MPKYSEIRKAIRSLIKKDSGEWLEQQSGWVGGMNGVVEIPDGKCNVRLLNGNVVEVVNRLAPGRVDMPVRIGRSRTLPEVWQVIEIRNVFDTPAGGGAIRYHYQQHMYGAEDMFPIHRKQITQLTATISPDDGDFAVRVYGDVRLTADGYIKI